MVREHIEALLNLPQAPPSVADSEALCRRLALSHYENFTVVSRFIPRAMRQPLYNLYAFCRTVDDIGDEAPGDRSALLDRFAGELDATYEGTPHHPVLVALKGTIERFGMPHDQFVRLITANRIDQEKARYNNFEELLHYCEHSATPVGRLFLILFGYNDDELFSLSDNTCIALQLTNFWQDVKRDYENGRIYLPLDEMRKFGVSEDDLSAARATDQFKDLLRFQVKRARDYFRGGLPLIDRVRGSLRVDLALFSRGGLLILDKIEQLHYDTLRERPTLAKSEKIRLFLSTLVSRRWKRWI
ncbi:MAG TPA: squalene synthase HpnC [Candidatus Acetothermia bacterium]|nr:squalene synthase HpnC [Candidatus Acetothermia bacterium]